ncbi:Transcriptional regulator, partial [Burkholderia cenocepacia PC184]
MNPPAPADVSKPYDVIDIPPEFAPTAVHPMRVRARQVDAGRRIPLHTHAWAQLAYASRGVLRVATTGTTWMVPPSRAIWVPPHVTHEVTIVEEAYLRTLYIDESIVPGGLDACRVVEVTGLLRELIVALDARDLSTARERLLCGLVLDELSQAEPLPLAGADARRETAAPAVRIGPGAPRACGVARTLGERGRREHAHDIAAFQAGTGRELFAVAPAGAARPGDPAAEPGAPAVAYRARTRLPEPERVLGHVPPRLRRKPARVHAPWLRTSRPGRRFRGQRNAGRRRRPDRRGAL